MDLRSLKEYFSPKSLALAAGLLVVHQLLSLAAPYLIKIAIDDGIAAQRIEVLWYVGAGGLAIYTASALTRFGGIWLTTKIGEQAWHHLRGHLFAHIQSMSLAEIQAHRVGSLVARVYSDTYHIKQLATSVLPALVSLVVGVGGTAIILLVLAPQLVLLALVPIPVGIVVLQWFRKYVRPLTKEKMEQYSHLHAALQEGIAGAEDVKVLGAQAEMARRVDQAGRDLQAADLALAWHRIRLGPAADFGISLILLGTLVAGGYLAIHDVLSVGVVVVFYFYVGRALGPIRRIPGLVYSWHSVRAALDRMAELLSSPGAIDETDRPEPAEQGPLRLEIEDLRFAYGEDAVALDGFDLVVDGGDRVAILGPSGVGKSTTARLLLRLMDGDQGVLKVQGLAARDWSIAELRRRVGYVGQEVFLFGGTLEENLLLGLDEVPDQAVLRQAIDDAGLRDVVDSGRGGLAMAVGERGRRLSGGQRKRVALARALLREPDLMIVDQLATDLEEGLNQEIFFNLRRRGLTLVYFGHRVPAGLQPAQVYWMERGRLAPYEVGPYDRR